MNNLYFVIKLVLLYQKRENNLLYLLKKIWAMLGIEPATSAAVVNMLTSCAMRPFISKQENEL